MRYFRLNLMGDTQDRTWAFIDTIPDGLDGFDYKMAMGEPIGDQYPKDASIRLQPASPGIRLPALLGNTLGYLIVNTAMKEVMKAHEMGAVEWLPFTLINHKNRVHSTDYWIVNPLGTQDCLNRAASEIRYVDDNPGGVVVAVRTYVFDPACLEGAPDLFRIPEVPREQFVSERLAKAFHTHAFSNVFIFKTELQPVS